MSKRILCYGDSNTYGFDPADGERYSAAIRWTSRLQDMLGDDYTVINAGLNARTTDLNDPFQEGKNGMEFLKPILFEYLPIDLMILMLGSNDLKFYFHRDAPAIAEAVGRLMDCARDVFDQYQDNAQILLMSPPWVGENISTSAFHLEFKRKKAVPTSRALAPLYEEQAQFHHAHFLDLGPIAQVSDIDSLHLSPEGHQQVAEAVYKKVHEIFHCFS